MKPLKLTVDYNKIKVECPKKYREEYEEIVNKFNEYLKGDVRKEDLDSLKFIIKQCEDAIYFSSKEYLTYEVDPRDPKSEAIYIVYTDEEGVDIACFNLERCSHILRDHNIRADYNYNYPKFFINEITGLKNNCWFITIYIPLKLFNERVLKFIKKMINKILRERYDSREVYQIELV